MYMSYCRFEGTLNELRACIADVEDHIYDESEEPVSSREVEKFEVMVTEFYDWLNDMCLIDEMGELDTKELKAIAKKMREGRETA